MFAVIITIVGVAVLWGYFVYKVIGEKDIQGMDRWIISIAATIIIFVFQYNSTSAVRASNMSYIPTGFFILSLIAYFTSVAAQTKGRGPVLWFVLGTLFSIIPVVILVIIPVKSDIPQKTKRFSPPPNVQRIEKIKKTLNNQTVTNICSHCGHKYSKNDYREDAEVWKCSQCKAKIEKI